MVYSKLLSVLAAALSLSSCAHLHHAQLGQIDNRSDMVGIPFEIKLSEMGVSTEEAGHIARALGAKGANEAAALIGLFQMGPRTGNLVYDEHYAENLIYQIYKECPSGQVTDLMSVRETRKYPVISGEIIKVTGTCRRAKTAAAPSNDEGA